MADNRTMAQLLQAPTEGYEDAIVILEIAANNFELKHGLINLVKNKQFFGHDKEDPHTHIRYFNKIISTMRVPNFFPPSKTTNLRNEITRFQQRFDESFSEACDRFNELLRACPHHGFSELHQLDTFYNALNVNDHDSLNSTAGGNFLDKMLSDCLKIIESKSKVRQSRAKAVVAKVNSNSSTPAISSDVAELKDLVRALLLDKKNQSSAPAPSLTPAPVKAVEPNCVTCGGQLHRPQVNQPPAYQAPIPQTQSVSQTDFERYVKANDAVLRNIQSQGQRSGTLPGNTITNTKEDLKDMSFEISFTEALILMPKFASTLKALIGNKEKLSEMARTSMNEHCSTVILNKLPKKLRDPRKLLIPCEFPGMDECLARCFLKTGRALIDVHKGELTLRIGNVAITYNLEQTSRYSTNYDQITANKIDVTDMACKEYSQEVLGFSDVTTSGSPTPSDDPIISTTSPTLTPFGDSDFLLFEEADAFLVILNSEPSPPIPNHEQSMSSFKKELKACEANMIKSSVDEPPEVKLKDLPPHLEYAFLKGDNKLPVIIAKELIDEKKSALIKVLKSHKRAIAWKLLDIHGINPEFCTQKILMEEDYKPAVQHQRQVNPKIHDVIKKEVEKLLDAGLIYPISDSPWVSP
nr:reverse transcriptase domain-containing protein [Tanacetum cinerariifolium]